MIYINYVLDMICPSTSVSKEEWFQHSLDRSAVRNLALHYLATKYKEAEGLKRFPSLSELIMYDKAVGESGKEMC